MADTNISTSENKKRKVHIALVGGQPAPVVYGIKATEPDLVEFIYSNESKQNVESIKKFITPVKCDMSAPLNATDAKAISQRADSLAEKYWNDEVCINISSGSKPWAYLIPESFIRHPACKVIFIDQENMMWDLSEHICSPIEIMNVFDHVKLYGTPLTKYTDIKTFTPEDRLVSSIMETLWTQCRQNKIMGKEFQNLLSVLGDSEKDSLRDKSQDSFQTNGNKSYVEWKKPRGGTPGKVTISILGQNEVKIRSPHALDLAFNSGWFEYKVADMLSRWPEAKSVYLNCNFETRELGPKNKKSPKNEIDVMVQTTNRLLFVECKTYLSKPTDVDKFKNAVKTYAGTSCQGIVVSYRPLSTVAREKIVDSKLIPPFVIVNNLISTEEHLFEHLDKYIHGINI